jgi:hypothetical protein
MSESEIGKLVGTSWQNVQQHLDRVEAAFGPLDGSKRVTIKDCTELAVRGLHKALAARILAGGLEDVSTKDLLVGIGILTDKLLAYEGRTGQSGNTVNISLSFPGNQVPDSQGCVIDITDQSAPAPAPAIAASPADDATLDVKVDW